MAKRIPPEVLEYLRKLGKAYGSQGGKKAAKKHDGCGTIGPREERVPGRGPEAHGPAASAGSINQTGKRNKATR
jgi:hypothetical protein